MITTEIFIERAIKIHGNKYNYDKSNYIGSIKKITITCNLHGDFEQVAVSHTKGSGCPECKGVKKLTTEDFIKRANEVHKNRYTYSNSVFINNRTKLIITCSKHGDFEQKANTHLNGAGCAVCGGVAVMSNEDCIEAFKAIHGSKYNYDRTVYTGSQEKLIIGCSIHGYFEQRASTHFLGQGCNKCAALTKGWTKTQFKNRCNKNNNGLGILYVIRCFNESESFYKVGITSNDVKRRYDGDIKMPYTYEVIEEINTLADEVYILEKLIHKNYSGNKYKPKISFGGENECYRDIKDIKKYINEYNKNKSLKNAI